MTVMSGLPLGAGVGSRHGGFKDTEQRLSDLENPGGVSQTISPTSPATGWVRFTLRRPTYQSRPWMRGMTEQQQPRYLGSLTLGQRLHLPITGWRITGLLIAALIFWWISTSDGSWAAATIAPTIAGALLAFSLGPTPKPTDHSGVAIQAVEELSELLRAQATLIEDAGEVRKSLEDGDDGLAKYRLNTITAELERQRRTVTRQIGHWQKVAPGSDDEIVKGRESMQATLEKLELEQEQKA